MRPYIARCNHIKCGERRTFETEEQQKKYGDDHLLIFGDGHQVYYAKKAKPE